IPDIQFPYNELALAFSTTDDAPEVSDPRISEMQPYYDEGKFYRRGEVLYGRFAVHPDHHPVRQLHPIDRARGRPRADPRPDRLRLRPTRLPRLNCPSTVELEDTVCQRRHPSIRVPGPPGNSTIPVPPLPPPCPAAGGRWTRSITPSSSPHWRSSPSRSPCRRSSDSSTASPTRWDSGTGISSACATTSPFSRTQTSWTRTCSRSASPWSPSSR